MNIAVYNTTDSWLGHRDQKRKTFNRYHSEAITALPPSHTLLTELYEILSVYIFVLTNNVLQWLNTFTYSRSTDAFSSCYFTPYCVHCPHKLWNGLVTSAYSLLNSNFILFKIKNRILTFLFILFFFHILTHLITHCAYDVRRQ